MARANPKTNYHAVFSDWIKILARGTPTGYLTRMDTMKLDTGQPASAETDAGRQRDLAWEIAMIADAEADVAAGRLVDEADVDAWIDSLGTNRELPVPYAKS